MPLKSEQLQVNSTKTILLVVQPSPLRTDITKILRDNGYMLIYANDGKQALAAANLHGGEIDLLLSEVETPGMTGIELAIQLNQERPHTKILLMSSLDSGLLVLNNGWQFLPKPFMADMLKDRIRDFLSEISMIEHIPESVHPTAEQITAAARSLKPTTA